MLSRKKRPSEEKQAALTGAAKDFEATVIDLAKRSERKAWWVATGASVLALLLAGGYALVMPLKEQVPYLVLADPYRGTSTVARLDKNDNTLTSNEAINKSNVAHFVIARESYDWDLFNRRDKRVVQSMATGNALKEYQTLYNPANPESPDNVYGKNASIRVKILSTILTWNEAKPDETTPRAPATATVRFERWQFDNATGRARFLDTKIASMKVGYDRNLQMNEEGRMENPLGFRVFTYRVDADSMGANTSANPPTAAETAAPAPAAVNGAGTANTVQAPSAVPGLPAVPDTPVPATTTPATVRATGTAQDAASNMGRSNEKR